MSIRDLVVTLSLETGAFAKGMAAVKSQIRDAEADFKLLGAGIEDFETTINGAQSKLDLLNEKLRLQNEALELYSAKSSKAVAEVRASWINLQKAQNALDEYTGAHGIIQITDAAMAADPELKKLVAELDKCKVQLVEREQAEKATIATEKLARASTIELANAVQKQKIELQLVKDGWYQYKDALAQLGNAAGMINAEMRQTDANFNLAIAGNAKWAQSSSGLQTQLERQRESQTLLNELTTVYTNEVDRAGKAYTVALASGQTDKINEASQALTNARLNLTNTEASLKSIQAEIQATQQELTLANGGWYSSADAIKGYQDVIGGIDHSITMAQLEFKKYAVGIKEISESANALRQQNSMLEKSYGLLQDKLKAQNRILDEAKNKLNAATKAGDADKIREATKEVQNAETAVKQTEIALDEITVKIEQNGDRIDELTSRWRKFASGLTSIGSGITAFGNILGRTGNYMSAIGNTVKRFSSMAIDGIKDMVQASIDYETTMVNIRKTVQATEDQYASMSNTIREMSETLGTTTEEIGSVMQTGAQLGIATDQLENFTKVIVDVSNTSTDLGADEAATQFAKFANIVGMEQSEFSNLGSTVVSLGNSMATTEGEISAMMLKLAASGKQVGLTNDEIVGFSAALSSVGVSAALGGNAFSKALREIDTSVATNNKNLKSFAEVAGMTTESFSSLWKQSASAGFMAFLKGLAQLDEEGTNAIVVLEDLGIKELRLTDTLLRAKSANGLFENSLAKSRTEWNANTALSEKAAIVYASTEKRIASLQNKYKNLSKDIGDDFNPTVMQLIEFADGAASKLGNIGSILATSLSPMVDTIVNWANQLLDTLTSLDTATYQTIIRWAGWALAGAPVVAILGKIVSGIGAAVKAIGTIVTAVGAFATSAAALPVTLTALGVAVVAGVAYFADYATGARAARDAQKELNDTLAEYNNLRAQTFYEESEGLPYFGLSEEDLKVDTKDVQDAFEKTMRTWSDGLKEDDEIMNTTISYFTDLTKSAREKFGENLSEEDLDLFNAWDEAVTDILKRNQNKKMSAEDEELLKGYFNAYQEWIEAHGGFNFDTLSKETNVKLISGADSEIKIAQEAAVAGSQGYNAAKKAIKKQYEDDIREIFDSDMTIGEKEDAYNKLLERRTDDLKNLSAEYLAFLKEVYPNLQTVEMDEKATEQVGQLFSDLKEYRDFIDSGINDDTTKADLLGKINTDIEGLDTTNLETLLRVYTQLVDIAADNPELADEIEKLLPEGVTPQSLSTLLGLTEGYDELENVRAVLEGIKSDMTEFTIKFNLETAQKQWEAFTAENDTLEIHNVILAKEDDRPKRNGTPKTTYQKGNMKNYVFEYEQDIAFAEQEMERIYRQEHPFEVKIKAIADFGTTEELNAYWESASKDLFAMIGITGIEPKNGATWQDLYDAITTGNTDGLDLWVDGLKVPEPYADAQSYIKAIIGELDPLELSAEMQNILRFQGDFDNMGEWIQSIQDQTKPIEIGATFTGFEPTNGLTPNEAWKPPEWLSTYLNTYNNHNGAEETKLPEVPNFEVAAETFESSANTFFDGTDEVTQSLGGLTNAVDALNRSGINVNLSLEVSGNVTMPDGTPFNTEIDADVISKRLGEKNRDYNYGKGKR